jgi:hypothetical protein
MNPIPTSRYILRAFARNSPTCRLSSSEGTAGKPIAGGRAPPDINSRVGSGAGGVWVVRAGLLIVALFLATAPQIAAAEAVVMPAVPYFAMHPTMPPTPYPDSPVQQQILQNYRTQLLQTQRQRRQNNPGFSREQLEIGRRLGAFGPASRL